MRRSILTLLTLTALAAAPAGFGLVEVIRQGIGAGERTHSHN